MNIIINNASMKPIYEQIIDQIRADVLSGALKENTPLPSVRTLSKDARISALTVKKAYDALEEEGIVITVHGKGSYIAPSNKERMLEERKKELEDKMEKVIAESRQCGLSNDEIMEMVELIMEEV